MASMGMGGMMGNMGMGNMGMTGGMGAFSMNYPPEQMPHVFLKVAANKDKQEVTPSMAQIGRATTKAAWARVVWRSHGRRKAQLCRDETGPAGMMAMSAFSMVSGFMPGMRPGAPKIT